MKIKELKNDITFQQGTFHTKHAGSKNTTQNWFPKTDLAYIHKYILQLNSPITTHKTGITITDN
jgi:hypothetical protein